MRIRYNYILQKLEHLCISLCVDQALPITLTMGRTCSVLHRSKLLAYPYILLLKLMDINDWMDQTGLTDHPNHP